jgi:eukaryotic-like serine/threonine-protein kinase
MDHEPQSIGRGISLGRAGTLPLPGATLLQHPPERLGRYRLLHEIGAGATSRVFAGEDDDGKRCAVKVSRRTTATSFTAGRFALEARVLASVESPAVVELLEGGLQEGEWSYHLLELVAGESLDSAFTGALPPRDVLRVALPIAEGLAAIHAAGWAHGDVKPANVVIALDRSGSWRVKLVDLGSAQAMRDTDDLVSCPGRFGLVCGSPAYMAPEQAAGRAIDARSDVYAFGLLLYELLTGRPRARRDGSARALPDRLPPTWRALLSACLRDEPAHRPQTMAAVLYWLRSTMLERPSFVPSRPPRALGRELVERTPVPPHRPARFTARLGA